MTEVVGINGVKHLTPEQLVESARKEGSAKKFVVGVIYDTGEVSAYTTNNMTPAEELFLCTFLHHGSVSMGMNAQNANKFDDNQYEW